MIIVACRQITGGESFTRLQSSGDYITPEFHRRTPPTCPIMTSTQRTPRLFLDEDLIDPSVRLDERAVNYLGRVLRMKRGDRIIVFNGHGTERGASIALLARREGTLDLHETVPPLPESGLDLVLLQALLKSEPMDIVVQKATELGVRTIIPVQTEFSVTRLEGERAARRLEHWILRARAACEQSGRHRPPQILSPAPLAEALDLYTPGRLALLLHRDQAGTSPALPRECSGICLAAGPEGGFSPAELDRFARENFVTVQLGPRTLRAETASVAGCTFAQLRWGDMAVRAP
jgi:16S rRNA (uracil1498-N3)-methyltransferase